MPSEGHLVPLPLSHPTQSPHSLMLNIQLISSFLYDPCNQQNSCKKRLALLSCSVSHVPVIAIPPYLEPCLSSSCPSPEQLQAQVVTGSFLQYGVIPEWLGTAGKPAEWLTGAGFKGKGQLAFRQPLPAWSEQSRPRGARELNVQ